MFNKYINFLVRFLFLLFFVCCARKKHLDFKPSDKENVFFTKKLLLPYACDISIKKIKGNDTEYLISWCISKKINCTDLEFLGYNIYTLSSCNTISTKPINKEPIQKRIKSNSLW